MSSQKSSKSTLNILRKGEALDTASTKKSITSLLSSHDGTEVIHQELEIGARWGLSPEDDGSDTLEAVYILTGKMRLHTTKEDYILDTGDYIAGHPVSEHLILTAMENTSFLYVSSRPIFHYYRTATNELETLAINIEKKDGYTAEHCYRIKNLSMLVGEKMGLKSDSLQKLHFGALLHDIGKTKVPESILLKPGKLSDDEWVIMKNHTRYGSEILIETDIPHLILAAQVVEEHHERYDGSGYPKGLQKEQICLEGAIVGLVDSYDAITSDRVYQKGRTKESAIAEIKQLRGIKYHPDVVDTFLTILGHD